MAKEAVPWQLSAPILGCPLLVPFQSLWDSQRSAGEQNSVEGLPAFIWGLSTPKIVSSDAKTLGKLDHVHH